jgi:hypothetical protein
MLFPSDNCVPSVRANQLSNDSNAVKQNDKCYLKTNQSLPSNNSYLKVVFVATLVDPVFEINLFKHHFFSGSYLHKSHS